MGYLTEEDETEEFPKLIHLDNVIKVSAKHRHMLALTKDGTLFAMGENHENQCGVGSNEEMIDSPMQVVIDNSLEVIHMSAGYDQSGVKCGVKCGPKTQLEPLWKRI